MLFGASCGLKKFIRKANKNMEYLRYTTPALFSTSLLLLCKLCRLILPFVRDYFFLCSSFVLCCVNWRHKSKINPSGEECQLFLEAFAKPKGFVCIMPSDLRLMVIARGYGFCEGKLDSRFMGI